MILLFMLGMTVVSMLVIRLARPSRRRPLFGRQPGRSDGVRTVYKRHP